MLASYPASMMNQKQADLGIPKRIDLTPSRFRRRWPQDRLLARIFRRSFALHDRGQQLSTMPDCIVERFQQATRCFNRKHPKIYRVVLVWSPPKKARNRTSLPVASTATPVSAATEQQHEHNDNQDQFHGISPLTATASFAEYLEHSTAPSMDCSRPACNLPAWVAG